MSDIKKVAVIGAGVMGASIAAHIANAGIPVRLLDVPGQGFGKKNALSQGAVEKLLAADPECFMHKRFAKLVECGNTDELDDLKDCDWIIEAIVEKLDIKQDLYQRLEKVCKPTAIISSNTSTIPLETLVSGMPASFQERFLIAHFFNPPRYMRLLELVKGKTTKQAYYDSVADFADRMLGKTVVNCHDTPGFIGNRIGIFWVTTAFEEALAQGMRIEDADAVLSKPLGIPKTGIFALMDLVGIDLIPLLGRSLGHALSKDDLYVKTFKENPLVDKMIADGYTGRKGKGGFYRQRKDDNGKRINESLDLKTGEYGKKCRPRLACLEESKDLKRFLTFPEDAARYALKVMGKVLWYAASLVPEISHDIYSVDVAMKLGYNWKYGPFELMDKLGAAWLADYFASEGLEVPDLIKKVGSNTFYRTENGQLQYFGTDGKYHAVERPKGQLLLSDIKRASAPLLKNASASLWDVGDKVVCLEFTSKMNSIDPEIFKMIHQSIDFIQSNDYRALVIHNEGSHFSVGANIGMALFAINIGLYDQIYQMVEAGQNAYLALKYAPFPVVGAPSGMALGGGCEILLHCDAVQAHAELYMGLVEVGVGLIPAWGGCKEMLTRWITASKRPGGAMVAVGKVFETIGTAKVSKSAAQAQELMFLREHDSITMNKDRLLYDAKEKALQLAKDYKAPEKVELSLPGGMAKVGMTMAVKGFVKIGKATPYDEVISDKLSTVLSGGDTDITDTQSEEAILKLEREGFMELLHNRQTLDRMEHTLATGKPLRN